MGKISGKKVIMIIAIDDFRDEELKEPKDVLETEGAKVLIASTKEGTAKGMLGGSAKVEVSLKNVKAQDYDAIIFVGGVGASCYWDDPAAHTIAKSAVKENKVLGAICIAPVTLAKAGVLKGKRATAYPSEGKKLQDGGAIYTKTDVEIDGDIITADGPKSASKFGKAIVDALAK